jgi:predicted metal-dependent hydrolase
MPPRPLALYAHSLQLHQHSVGYVLRRSNRRSIGFVVDGQGLSVLAPKWLGMADIESALREKSNWILRKLTEQQNLQQRLQAAQVVWGQGAVIPFLGELLTLTLGSSVDGAIVDQNLHVSLAPDAAPEKIARHVRQWFQHQAAQVFAKRCQHYAPLLGVQCHRLGLSSAKNRWGSASANGSIRLHWRLVHFQESVIDYVVAHELAHLREMNHSPRFWSLVRSVLPCYEVAQLVLKNTVLPVLDP